MKVILIILSLISVTTGLGLSEPHSADAADKQAGSTQPATAPVRASKQEMGILLKIEGTTLVLNVAQKGKDVQEARVETNEHTQYLVDGDHGALSDLHPGMRLTVIASPPLKGHADKRMMVIAASEGVSGTIARLGEGSIVVTLTPPHADHPEAAFKTDAKTRVFLIGGRNRVGGEGKISDLKLGMLVKILSKSGTASKIFVHP